MICKHTNSIHVFGNQHSKKDYFEENGANYKPVNGQTSQCRASELELRGAEPNGIKFQNDSQSGKSSDDRHLSSCLLCVILPFYVDSISIM